MHLVAGAYRLEWLLPDRNIEIPPEKDTRSMSPLGLAVSYQEPELSCVGDGQAMPSGAPPFL
jgi:hypothetical protein